ncbi:MAG TPA: HK97 family phage prohead protease, partial [Planctomycetota bacterium]|nr:HK97 family phage prohead protease [Planctomycetota bacterium]
NEETRSFEAVMATDKIATVFDWRSLEFIDETLRIEGATFDDQLVLLESHSTLSLDSVLGSVRNIRNDKGRLLGRAQLAEGDEVAERAWNKVKQGHLRDVSIGYRVLEFEDIKPGQTKEIGGQKYTADQRTLRITTKFEVKELSLVPIGADANAKIRTQPVGGHPTISRSTETSAMNEQLRTYLQGLGLRADASVADAWAFYRGLQADQLTEARGLLGDDVVPSPAAPDPTPPKDKRSEPTPPPPVPPKPEVDEAAIRKAERERIAAIEELRSTSRVADQIGATIDHCLEHGQTIDQARSAVLIAERAAVPPPVSQPHYSVGADQTHQRNRNLHALGFMQRIGAQTTELLEGVRTEQDQQELARQGRRFTDMSLLDVCRHAIQIDGGTPPDGRMEVIQRAAVSGGSLSYIFTTSINARLMAGYNEAGDTSDWCEVTDVANYLTQDRYQLDKMGALAKVPEGGTAEHAHLGDGREQYAIARYGKQLVLDEIAIINDNLDVFTKYPFQMGQAALRLRPDLVYSIILANAALSDSVALFYATTHVNLLTTALSAAALGASVSAMALQRQNGVCLNLRASYLIVNPTLEWTAREIISSSELVLTGTTDNVRGSRNVMADLNLQLRVDGRLGAAGVTDPASGTAYTGSTTAWYLAAAPGANTIEVAYLAGTGRRPVLRSFMLDRGQWGLGWDIKHSVGAKALDWRGLHCGKA